MFELLGFLLPAVIDLVNRKIADTDMRYWISVAFCAVVGVGTNWLNTGFAFTTPLMAADSIAKSIIMVFGAAQFSYKVFWENSKVRNDAGLNAKTNDENNV